MPGLSKTIAYLHATLEPLHARVLVELPNGEIGLIRGITSKNGEIIIQATMDAREELK
jgi:hypothetical protein